MSDNEINSVLHGMKSIKIILNCVCYSTNIVKNVINNETQEPRNLWPKGVPVHCEMSL